MALQRSSVIIRSVSLLQPWASRRCSLPVPIELVVVVVASLVGARTDLFAGLRSIGAIPTGIQAPKLPPLELLPLVSKRASASNIQEHAGLWLRSGSARLCLLPLANSVYVVCGGTTSEPGPHRDALTPLPSTIKVLSFSVSPTQKKVIHKQKNRSHHISRSTNFIHHADSDTGAKISSPSPSSPFNAIRFYAERKRPFAVPCRALPAHAAALANKMALFAPRHSVRPQASLQENDPWKQGG